MPLSEEELRLLEQMERALVEEDPKFASTLRGTSLRHVARRRAIMAGAGFVIGVVVMMAGAIAAKVVVGILGFLIMLVCATLSLTAMRSQRHVAAPSPGTAQAAGSERGFTVIQGGGGRSWGGGGPRPPAPAPSPGTAQAAGSERGFTVIQGGGGRSWRRSRRRPRDTSFMERLEQRWRRRRDDTGGW